MDPEQLRKMVPVIRQARSHLRQALELFEKDAPDLFLADLQHHLKTAHLHLLRLAPNPEPADHLSWERWSVVLFHFRASEVKNTLKGLLAFLGPALTPAEARDAARTLQKLHFTLIREGRRGVN